MPVIMRTNEAFSPAFVQALDYLHASRVVHGDLKPENALMSGLGRVALSDFGCAKVLPGSGGSGEGGGGGDEDEGLLDRCNGTPAFLAPEMMRPNARFRWALARLGSKEK